MREASIKTKLIKRLNDENIIHRCLPGSPWSGGLPDVIACHKGRLVMFECKRPDGKLTPRQALELGRWTKAGALTFVVRSSEDIERAIRIIEIERRGGPGSKMGG